MWKPSKRLVTWVLVILLMYNISTLVLTMAQMSRISPTSTTVPDYAFESDGLHIWPFTALGGKEATWWIEEMNKIDNSPRIMITWRYNWELSPHDEIVLYGFKLQRTGSAVRLVETGIVLGPAETGVTIGNTTAARYNWVKNLLVPWMHETTTYYFHYWGAFENLIVENSPGSEVARWENLNCVLISGAGSYPEVDISLWGPIQFIILVGSIIYVRKRWH